MNAFSYRYIEESMEDESKDDSLSTEDKPQPPMVNGLAVPIREAPARSAKAGGKRQQPMESEEYEMNGVANSADRLLNVSTVKFLNFRTPEIFAVIYLKFKQRQNLRVFRQKKCKWNSKQ